MLLAFLRMSLAKALKTLRKRKGLTPVALAAKARVTQASITELDTGARKDPPVDPPEWLAKALGMSLAELPK